MKEEYDFSKGERGKFYHPDAEFNLPIYLDPEIAEFIKKLAQTKNTDMNNIVNMLLKKDKELMHDYEDLRDLREAKEKSNGEKGIPLEQVISELEI